MKKLIFALVLFTVILSSCHTMVKIPETYEQYKISNIPDNQFCYSTIENCDKSIIFKYNDIIALFDNNNIKNKQSAINSRYAISMTLTKEIYTWNNDTHNDKLLTWGTILLGSVFLSPVGIPYSLDINKKQQSTDN
ncbi:MAG: hypothetical protein PHU62_02600 [Bacteroidales bacterium]|jgi:hypothetical protein|nr:hypothetical protein [Bacteroidales bacterium]MDD2204609.1 hypothetical protein [Bacteroidales bacterium]MDD3151288.1 hypothetical protein [Bacteroidales bacterium]MDD3914360.1 hypothetical protein [Bacteroidales bacterium]MDD4633454.1 hypothetical protein [Bacteroidales bacterium]